MWKGGDNDKNLQQSEAQNAIVWRPQLNSPLQRCNWLQFAGGHRLGNETKLESILLVSICYISLDYPESHIRVIIFPYYSNGPF